MPIGVKPFQAYLSLPAGLLRSLGLIYSKQNKSGRRRHRVNTVETDQHQFVRTET